jgi:DNA modification methylase
MKAVGGHNGKRNRRSVWTVTTKPFKGAHFATFPPDLIQPCILAGCPRGGTVLDPFGGAGTTGMVAERLVRNSVLIELNSDYCQMARDRIRADGGKVECTLPEARSDSGPLFEEAAE